MGRRAPGQDTRKSARGRLGSITLVAMSLIWGFLSAGASVPTCHVVRVADTYDGKQGLTYFCGIAAETVGSRGICMHLLTIPPGGRAKAHMHENHETAIMFSRARPSALRRSPPASCHHESR